MVPFVETVTSKEELIEECRKGFEAYKKKLISKNDFCMYFGFIHGEAITKYYNSYGKLLIDGGFNEGSEAYFHGGINAWKNLNAGKYTFPPFKSPSTSRAISTGHPLQTIYFGSPGTGKSYIIQSKILKGVPDEHIFRTTFHPDSDYSSFVGCYKPQMKDGNIRYDFAPQVFTKAYCKAWKNPSTPVYLIIEEINRGNCAQIFGDLFQLLDRRNGVSEYPVDADSDLGNFLADDLKNFAENECDGSRGIENGKLCLPANLNIVATMNTSDQSLFPMDSAFKRRWEWRFIPTSPAQKADRLLEYSIEDGAVSADGRIINAGDYEYSWKEFLEKINRKILLATRSEDKQIGFWFTKTDSDGRISISDFVSKVVFYLWNDVFKDMGAKDGNPFTVKIDGKNTLLPYNSFFEENFEGEIVECLGVVHTFLINVGLMPIQPAEMKSEVTHPASAPQENAGSE